MPTLLISRCESLNPAPKLGFQKSKKMQGVKFADQKRLKPFKIPEKHPKIVKFSDT